MSTTTCSLPRCTDAFYALDLCEAHYNKQRRVRDLRGDGDKVSTEPARLHALLLRRRGWTWTQIAGAAKSSSMMLRRIERGEQPLMRRDKVNRITSIDPTWQDSAVVVPYLGTGRRLGSLAWQGWSGAEVSRRLGFSVYVFRNGAYTGTVESRTAAAVARFFDEHAYKPGPNTAFAKKARTLGAIPAAAWDGDLDDPDTQPEVASPKPARRSVAVLVENYDYLVDAGLSEEQAAARLGIKPESIGPARKRARESQARTARKQAVA